MSEKYVESIITPLSDGTTNKQKYIIRDKEGRELISELTNNLSESVADINEELNKKVDKISGKGLSTNDYTTAEKNKLANIESGAEVNVQSDWNVTNSSSDAYIKNKPTIDTAMSSTSTNAVQNKVINTALNGKVDKVSGKGLSTNDYTTTEKNKLAGIAAGAQVNVNADWNATSGDAQILNKPTTISGYGITDAYTKTQVDGLVSGVLHYKGTKATVSALPTSGNKVGDVWHITADGSEHAWDGSVWQELGTATDLSAYYTSSQVDGLLNNKVTTEAGKGLSTNDYTTAEKNKLAGIAAGAEVNVQADWNTTATSADSFIKNKPNVYTKTEIDEIMADVSSNFIVHGQIEYDSTTYAITGWHFSDGTTFDAVQEAYSKNKNLYLLLKENVSESEKVQFFIPLTGFTSVNAGSFNEKAYEFLYKAYTSNGTFIQAQSFLIGKSGDTVVTRYYPIEGYLSSSSEIGALKYVHDSQNREGVILNSTTNYAYFGAVAAGTNTTASHSYSFAEGSGTLADGMYSHAEGGNTTAQAIGSHAEGYQTYADGSSAHAEGYNTTAMGPDSHAEGQGTIAAASQGHAEGLNTSVSGFAGHAEGTATTAMTYAHAEGNQTLAQGESSHAEGYNTRATGEQSHAEGYSTTASGIHSHTEGVVTKADGTQSHAEGMGTTAQGSQAHTEGVNTYASGNQAHAEGLGTTASKMTSHAEGYQTKASGHYAHAQGKNTCASGGSAHAQGQNTTASGANTHAQGYQTFAQQADSHAQGHGTTASGIASHVEGRYTIANRQSQHVFGEFNEQDPSTSSFRGDYIEIVGNGTATTARSNARTLDWSGNEWLAGNSTVAGGNLTLGSVTITEPTNNAAQFLNATGGWSVPAGGSGGGDGNTTYTLTATTGSNSTVHLVSGSSTVANVTIPNTTNTTYGPATTTTNGLMSSSDKTLLTSLQNNSITDMDFDGQNESNGYKIIVQTDSLNDPIEEIMIPQASTATHGVIKLDGTANHFLNGTGGWSGLDISSSLNVTQRLPQIDLWRSINSTTVVPLASATIPLANSSCGGSLRQLPSTSSVIRASYLLNGNNRWVKPQAVINETTPVGAVVHTFDATPPVDEDSTQTWTTIYQLTQWGGDTGTIVGEMCFAGYVNVISEGVVFTVNIPGLAESGATTATTLGLPKWSRDTNYAFIRCYYGGKRYVYTHTDMVNDINFTTRSIIGDNISVQTDDLSIVSGSDSLPTYANFTVHTKGLKITNFDGNDVYFHKRLS